ncbi:hypothetical protein BH09DEP1_BH09DEP1_1060 [soil metagenome]
MILFLMIMFISGQVYSMENKVDKVDVIDKDYTLLTPYVVKLMQITKDDFTPFELLRLLARPDALINSSISCNYASPSEHIQLLLKKQRIRMGRDYEKQKSALGDKDHLFAWFIAYFQVDIVDDMKKTLKQERDQKLEATSSCGV